MVVAANFSLAAVTCEDDDDEYWESASSSSSNGEEEVAKVTPGTDHNSPNKVSVDAAEGHPVVDLSFSDDDDEKDEEDVIVIEDEEDEEEHIDFTAQDEDEIEDFAGDDDDAFEKLLMPEFKDVFRCVEWLRATNSSKIDFSDFVMDGKALEAGLSRLKAARKKKMSEPPKERNKNRRKKTSKRSKKNFKS